MSNFKFGFSKEDITPKLGIPLAGYFNPRPNKGAYDRLSVKAAIFESKGEKTGIVSYDLCMIDHALTARFINALKAAKIDFAERLLFCATHTHTGPYTGICFDAEVDQEYINILVEKTVSAVKTAAAVMADAELFATQTSCDYLAFNRRYWMKDGTVLANPGKLNPNIDRPEGGIDPDIPLLAVKQNGIYQLLIVNIDNHTDTIGGDFVSADWPGRMEKEVQSQLGYDIPVMTIIGAQGNINHFNVKTDANQTSYAEACRIGKAYGNVLCAAMYQLNKVNFSQIKFDRTEVEVPYMTVTDAEYNEAKTLVKKYKDAKMEDGRDFTSEDIAKGHPFVIKFFAQRLIDCREKLPKEKAVEWMVSIKFGKEIALVSLPCEPFVEIGLGIKETSKFPITIIAGLGMGTDGYIGLDNHYAPEKSRAYETCPAEGKAGNTAGAKLMAAGIKLLK